MKLNLQQQKQFNKQIKAHRHDNYITDIILGAGHQLKNFKVNSFVLRPDIMSALDLAQWLFFNNGLYRNGDVLDMGSGTGIQGVVMGLYGAKKIMFADISSSAIKNTNENVKRYSLGAVARVVASDLFENVTGKFDLIVFNHPFFSDGTIDEQISTPIKGISRGSLIHRFLDSAKKYLKKDAMIVMPYFHLAGPLNNPATQAKKHGYKVVERFSVEAKDGLQRGRISIYTLSL